MEWVFSKQNIYALYFQTKNKQAWSFNIVTTQPNTNPTITQPNSGWGYTQLSLPTHHPTPHKLSKPAVATVVTAWRQHDISLMWGWHQTVWGTSHRRVQTGTGGYAWVRAGPRVYARIQTAQLTICLKQLWFSTVHIERIVLHEWQTYQWKAYS